MRIVIVIVLNINLFFINIVKSQYFIGGTHGATYFDIIPDTLINPNPYPLGDEYYYIDINQDGTDDIEIWGHSTMSGSVIQYVFISSLDTNTRFSFWKTNSVSFNPPCTGGASADILKLYSMGDTIKNGIYVQSGYLGCENIIGTCLPHLYCHEWVDATDHYIGIKYSDTSGVFYGWIRVNVTYSQIALIKDFSLGNPVAGIEPFSAESQFNIYPNPANNKVQIELTGNSIIKEIILYDLLGKELLKTKEKNIDVSKFQEGVYFIQVEITAGVLTKKIIIQH